MTDHTCYYDINPTCQACGEEFTASPAGIVAKAIEALNAENQNPALGDLLQILSDEMNDEHAEEREFPEHIPSARWLVGELRHGRWQDTDRWTAALAVARSILGLPNPNATETVSA